MATNNERETSTPKGLGNAEEWPTLSAEVETQAPIDLLADKKIHQRVLDYLKDRLDSSERAMSGFYSRWKVNEYKLQAFINLNDYEQALKNINDKAEAPKPVSIIIPYSYATIATIVTYHLHTFAGRKPMFQVSSYKEEGIEAARMMETILQFNVDHTRLIKQLFQFFQDSQVYGVGVLRTQWETKTAVRTVIRQQQILDPATGMPTAGPMQRTREPRIVYEGNSVVSIDPFMFFPDPHVPMSEVNRKGEYCFWRNYEGKHTLKLMEREGKIKYVDRTPALSAKVAGEISEHSARNVLAGGTSTPAWNRAEGQKNWYQVDQGTCWIIPAELGLGSSDSPELWVFTMLNKGQIVQAEPLEADHGMHPVSVIEPYSLGYGFGHLGMSDFLAPMQDTISWFINSHMHNVRAVLNNMFVVDPSMIEMQDFKKSGPGKIIRMKKAAYGQDVRQAVQQLNVQDVTGQHVRDLELFMRLGDTLSSITDNLRGLQDAGGRKTATEVRTSAEAAASRLAAQARLISAQGLVDLTEQMCLNIQQYMSEEYYLQVVGAEGRRDPMTITPEMVVGDFHYPVHDGTLPLDRVAMVDVWKEIFMGVAADPELRQQFDVKEIFKYVAELGGARNIEQFELQPQPQVPTNVQFAPDDLAPEMAGPTPGVVGNPGRRLAGAL